MELRKATPADIPRILEIYDGAKASMREMNIQQWSEEYPNRDSALADIQSQTGYVLTLNGTVVATCCLAFGHEPTYDIIYDGAWEGDGPYGFLHRVAVDPACKGKGAAGLFFQELERQAIERGVAILRGDTHQDNLPMQRTMEKNGLKRRGTILLEDGSPRIAYERLL